MIVGSSDVSDLLCAYLSTWLNAAPSAWLCLYTNDLPLTPDTENPILFVEASYPGYARFGTVALWSPSLRDDPGIYHIECGPFTFAANGGTQAINVYGWFLLRGSRVVYMERFISAPYIIRPGGIGPTLKPRLTVGAQSVVCATRWRP